MKSAKCEKSTSLQAHDIILLCYAQTMFITHIVMPQFNPRTTKDRNIPVSIENRKNCVLPFETGTDGLISI